MAINNKLIDPLASEAKRKAGVVRAHWAAVFTPRVLIKAT